MKNRDILWTFDEIITALENDFISSTGPLDHGIMDVVIDGRTKTEQGLFIPLKGEQSDGHLYILQAKDNGCTATLLSEEYTTLAPQENMTCIIVKDTTKALIRLALFSRNRTHANLIAVTGSVGKTSTKDMLIHTFSQVGKTYGTKGNLNNHLGLPLSMARMPKDCQFGIFEIGMNHTGEISVLTQLLRPQLAIITEVAPAHTEFFKNIEEIADAKAEICEGVHKLGCIILPRDNPHFNRLLNKALNQNIENIVTFGYHEESHAKLVDYQNGTAKTSARVSATLLTVPLSYEINIKGEHQAKNSLAVLLALHFFHVLDDTTLASFNHIPMTKGRGDFITHNMCTQEGDIIVLDESYNASPAAMNASIHMLSIQPHHGRKVAILGDMKELGLKSLQYHIEIGKLLNVLPTLYVALVGHHIKILEKILPQERILAITSNAKEMQPLVKNIIHPHDMILIKGSNSMNMKIIVEELQTL